VIYRQLCAILEATHLRAGFFGGCIRLLSPQIAFGLLNNQ